MSARVLALLAHRRTYLVLIALNILVGGALVLSIALHGDAGADSHSYLALAQGILHGHYSMYWDLPHPYPDTFRAPGFPLYLALFLKLFGTWRWVGVVQAVLLVLSVHVSFKAMSRFGFGLEARNVFLLLLLSGQNILMYVPLVNPEIPALTCITLLTFFDPLYRSPRPFTGVALGLLAGFAFHCRPIFLLLPFLRLAFDLVFFRSTIQWRTMVAYIGTFVLTLLPFTLWNKAHHGVLRPTPLEGGGGVFHMGWWSGRIPDYHQHRYWGNFTGDEMIRFVPADSVPANIAAYEREWDRIDSVLVPLLTAADTDMLAHYEEYVNEKTFNSAYTQERERLLKQLTAEHMRAHPGYTFAFKCYTAVRLWVIGVDRGEFVRASAAGKVKLALPFIVTLLQFLLAVICVPLALRRKLLNWRAVYPMLFVVLYGWLISVPFTIQSRYTVPLRFVLFVLLAMSVVALLERRKHTLNAPNT